MSRAAPLSAALAALALLAGAVPAAEPAPAANPAATAAALAQPAVNQAFLGKTLGLLDKHLATAQSALDVAKPAAALPFAPKSQKDKVSTMQAGVDTLTALKGELTGLSQGRPAKADGIMAGLASGQGPSLTDRLKGVPGADVLQSVLGAPGVAQALVSATPVDQAPGYGTAAAVLGLGK